MKQSVQSFLVLFQATTFGEDGDGDEAGDGDGDGDDKASVVEDVVETILDAVDSVATEIVNATQVK